MIAREHILFFTNQARGIETLGHHFLGLSIPIHHVISGSLIVLAPHIQMDQILSVEVLIGDLGDAILAVFPKGDDIVDV